MSFKEEEKKLKKILNKECNYFERIVWRVNVDDSGASLSYESTGKKGYVFLRGLPFYVITELNNVLKENGWSIYKISPYDEDELFFELERYRIVATLPIEE